MLWSSRSSSAYIAGYFLRSVVRETTLVVLLQAGLINLMSLFTCLGMSLGKRIPFELPCPYDLCNLYTLEVLSSEGYAIVSVISSYAIPVLCHSSHLFHNFF